MHDTLSESEFVVVGGGLIGLATARALARGGADVLVLEAESRLATHQSGHNSGIIHSGLYYRPGSLKAELCAEGRAALYELCDDRGIAHERCGKLVLATRSDELPRLEELERRGAANGLRGLQRLDPDQIREHEPCARGLAGLWVPETGIVDYSGVARAYADGIRSAGGRVATSAALTAVRPRAGGLELATTAGPVRSRWLVNCAGLQSDRVARLCGADPAVRIVPFRGDYYLLGGESRSRVRGLIYPVPDPAFPFLGVHLTRTVSGEVEAGPNAVLAWNRHGYQPPSISARDAASTLGYVGFWRLAARHWRTGAYEWRRSLSRRLFARDLRRLVPEIVEADLRRGGCGIRAQAVGRDGSLADDFVIEHSDRALHVLNAPSPGATASAAIGRYLCERAVELAG